MSFPTLKIFPKKFLFLLLFVFTSCQKNSEHYEYWKNFFEFQNSLREHLQAENKWQIANGNLTPQREDQLYKTKSQNFALLWSIPRVNSKFFITQVDLSRDEGYSKNLENYLLVEYTPSKFKEAETYIFKRVLHYQSTSIYHTTEIITWIRFFQTQSDNIQFFLNSPLGNFLCKVFECEFKTNNESFIHSFKPTNELKNLDKTFYDRFLKLLESKFEVQFLASGNQFLKIRNQNQSLEFQWSKIPIPEYPQKILASINFYTKVYGLTIDIQNWIYELELGSAGRSSYLKGRFLNIPKYSLSGRIGYILPKQVLNLFIPENIDDYMKTFFELRLKGNRRKGNLWEVKIEPYFKYYRITSTIESESPRKTFRFWSSENKETSSEIFEQTFKRKLLESMSE